MSVLFCNSSQKNCERFNQEVASIRISNRAVPIHLGELGLESHGQVLEFGALECFWTQQFKDTGKSGWKAWSNASWVFVSACFRCCFKHSRSSWTTAAPASVFWVSRTTYWFHLSNTLSHLCIVSSSRSVDFIGVGINIMYTDYILLWGITLTGTFIGCRWLYWMPLQYMCEMSQIWSKSN